MVPAGLDMPYSQLSDVSFETHVKPERQKNLFLEIRDYVSFYDKKAEEGKPYRVSIIACANKLLHWIYALLKSKTTFQDVA